MVNTRAEVEQETKKPYIINETRNWFFKKLNKIDKLLANPMRKRREKDKMNKIRGEKGDVVKNTSEVQRIIWECFENLD
jgi:hypothetical protein